MSFPLSFAGPLGSPWGAGGASLKSWGWGQHRLLKGPGAWAGTGVEVGSGDRPCKGVQPSLAPTETSIKANRGNTLPPGPAHTDGSVSLPQCAGEEDWVDSRTVYVGRREPPPGAEAYIPQRYPDNRIVSSKVSICPGLPHVAPRALRTP